MPRVPPYDTGKVKIGLYYEPKQHVIISGDMERLQTALLGQRGRRLAVNLRQGIQSAHCDTSEVRQLPHSTAK